MVHTTAYEHYIVRMAKWLSHNAAKLIGLVGKRGSIELGYFADLIIWAPEDYYTVTESYSAYPET
jgi:dihydroorotase-like cyclic amidohydrolase